MNEGKHKVSIGRFGYGTWLMKVIYRFPYKIGYDCAGIVAEIGQDVSRFKFGDEVFVRVPEESRGMSCRCWLSPASYQIQS